MKHNIFVSPNILYYLVYTCLLTDILYISYRPVEVSIMSKKLF